MESKGVSGKPVYAILEGGELEIIVANAQHVDVTTPNAEERPLADSCGRRSRNRATRYPLTLLGGTELSICGGALNRRDAVPRAQFLKPDAGLACAATCLLLDISVNPVLVRRTQPIMNQHAVVLLPHVRSAIVGSKND